MEDHVTLDNWKPREKINTLIQSQWRKEANNGNYRQSPGLDEINKIKMHIKRKKPDYEIMQAFGIDCATLLAIKTDRYHPVDGISLDTVSKIYKAFEDIENKIVNMYKALSILGDKSFTKKETVKKLEFKTLIKIAKKKTVTHDDEEDDEIE